VQAGGRAAVESRYTKIYMCIYINKKKGEEEGKREREEGEGVSVYAAGRRVGTVCVRE
jgi:hypothetical protein